MDSLIWLLGTLVLLLLLQRLLQREIQAVFLLIFRRVTASLTLFSVVFLPGVFLHELSHFLMAKLLFVRTGRFSLTPRPMANGRLQLGSVETAQGGLMRDALIGRLAVQRGALVADVGPAQLQPGAARGAAGSGRSEGFWPALGAVVSQNDFWIWFYLAFVISSTMFPSELDRRAWLPQILVGGLLVGAALLAGGGPWVVEHLAPGLRRAAQAVTAVLGISLGTHAVLILPIWGLRVLISRLTRTEVY